MPNIKKLMDEKGYQLSRVDCGLPATTPACQAVTLTAGTTITVTGSYVGG